MAGEAEAVEAMRCPVCKEPMIVVEHDAVEVDYCVTCHGIWLDAGELELLFGGDAAVCQKLLAGGDPTKLSKEKPRKCPMCGKKMEKSVAEGEQPFTYDRCPHGDGLWFDKGELQSLLNHGQALSGAEKISAFLGEVFTEKPQ